ARHHDDRHLPMILAWLVLLPFIAGVLAWICDRWSHMWPRWIALVGISGDFALTLALWTRTRTAGPPGDSPWLGDLNVRWIDVLGIQFHLGLDGLSLLLVLLTAFLGIMAVAASWTEIHDRVGLFHF